MLLANNRAIGLETRRRLSALLSDGTVEESSLALLERALTKTRPRSHAGWVFLLADSLGANRSHAVLAGSVAEVFCCAVDLVDDVEDGDATAYLPEGCPQAVQINLAAQMWVLVGVFSSMLDRALVSSADNALTPEIFRLASSMACGQHLEITQPSWSPATYERMTELTGGCQMEAYFRIAAYAAHADPSPFLPVTRPLGLLLQMLCDDAARDPRLLSLDPREMTERRAGAMAALRDAMGAIPAPAHPVVLAVACAAGLET